jgi:uncharacterized protein (DUF849 family)
MAAAQGKVIITCAITGAIHTPTMSPHLPITAASVLKKPASIAFVAIQTGTRIG